MRALARNTDASQTNYITYMYVRRWLRDCRAVRVSGHPCVIAVIAVIQGGRQVGDRAGKSAMPPRVRARPKSQTMEQSPEGGKGRGRSADANAGKSCPSRALADPPNIPPPSAPPCQKARICQPSSLSDRQGARLGPSSSTHNPRPLLAQCLLISPKPSISLKVITISTA
jgi:hypothetical protein